MKIFNIEMLKMQGLYEYAIKEVKNQSLLNHKNIVKLIECMRDDQNIYLIMEFCEQGNLINYIDQFQLNYEQCIKIAVDILNGLIELHRNNILHRDLKPNNILVKNGVFKISDFGVSTISKMAQTKCGTQKYMAPEVLKGKTYGFKSDLWSFGVIFYYLLFKEYPFGKETNSNESCKQIIEIEAETIDQKFNLMSKLKKQRSIHLLNQNQQLQDLFLKIFQYNPDERISISQLIKHSIFAKFFTKNEYEIAQSTYRNLEENSNYQNNFLNSLFLSFQASEQGQQKEVIFQKKDDKQNYQNNLNANNSRNSLSRKSYTNSFSKGSLIIMNNKHNKNASISAIQDINNNKQKFRSTSLIINGLGSQQQMQFRDFQKQGTNIKTQINLKQNIENDKSNKASQFQKNTTEIKNNYIYSKTKTPQLSSNTNIKFIKSNEQIVYEQSQVQTMSNVHFSNIYINLENSPNIQPLSQINNDNETVYYNNNTNYLITSRSNNYFDDVQNGNILLSPNKNNKKQQKQQNFPGSILSINCVRKKSFADDNSYMSDVPFEFEQSFTNLDSFEKTPQLLFKKPSYQLIEQSQNKKEDIQKLQLLNNEQNGQEHDFLHKQIQQEQQFEGLQLRYNQQQIQQSKQLQLNGKNTECQIQQYQNQEKILKKKKQFGVPILPPCKGKNNQIPEDIY